MFDLFDRTLERVTRTFAHVACALVTLIFTMIVIDVSIRMMNFTPPSFTLAVVEYALLYFAMFAAPHLVRHRGHVAIEALITTLPDRVRVPLAHIVYFVCLCVALIFTWYAVELEIEAIQTQNVDIRGIDMPLWLLYLPMPIGFVLCALEFLRYLFGPFSYYSYDRGEVRDDV